MRMVRLRSSVVADLTVLTTDVTAPNVPSQPLLYSGGGTSIIYTISIVCVADATVAGAVTSGVRRYLVFQSGVQVGEALHTTEGDTVYYSGFGVSNSTVPVTVKAEDWSGNVSAASAARNVTFNAASADTTPPLTPAQPTLLSGAGDLLAYSILIICTDDVTVPGQVTSGPDHYAVYQDDVFVGNVAHTTVGAGVVYNGTGVLNSAINVKVAAIDVAANVSAYSPVLTVYFTTSANSHMWWQGR